MSGHQSGRKTWLTGLALALVVFATYWPVHNYDFVRYDDHLYVFENPDVSSGLSWWGFVWCFVDAHSSNWHPLTWLSHQLDCQLFRLNAGAHHLVNVFLHCANTVLLLHLLATMTGAFWRSVIVAALFALHPLRVESVAWVSERKDVLSGLFFMLTLWAYVLHARQNREPGIHRTSRPFKFAVGFFVLGLLSKQMLVTVPALLLLLDYWPLQRLKQGGGAGSNRGRLRALLWEKLPFIALSLLFSVIALFAQRSGTATLSLARHGFWARMQECIVGYFQYLRMLFWPGEQCVLYLRPEHYPVSEIMWALMILTGISVVVVYHRTRRPWLVTGWLWYLISLLPVIGLVSIGMQSHADRYTYTSAIGFYLIIVWTISEAAGRWLPEKMRLVGLTTFAAAALLTCIVLTRQNLPYWRNTETLMKRALEVNRDNYIAHVNLAVYLSKQGRTNEAQIHYQRYRELDPDYAPTGPQETGDLPTNQPNSGAEH